MKILLLNSWYYPNLRGGAEHSVKLLAENFAKRGHEVAVFTIDSEKRKMVEEHINDVTVYRGTGGAYDIRKAYRSNKPLMESIKNKYLEIRNYSIIKELSRVNVMFAPDVVHINCIAGMSMSAVLYFRLKRVPIVYTLRDYFLDSPRNIIEKVPWTRLPQKLPLALYRWYTRKKSACVDAVTAPSAFTLNYYLDCGYFKNARYKECIVNSVDLKMSDVDLAIQEKRMHEKRNFMYAGSVTETKGIKPMLAAFMQTTCDTSLFICGSGNLCGYVEECAKKDKRIKLMGKLEPKKLSQVYRDSDIMIVPSLWAEPFGRVVIEAAQYGLYVIGSGNGGIPEIIRTIGCGEICDVNDINAFRDVLGKAFGMDLEESFRNIKKNIGRYSIEHQIDDFEALYSKLML